MVLLVLVVLVDLLVQLDLLVASRLVTEDKAELADRAAKVALAEPEESPLSLSTDHLFDLC